jgi:hypothetical protein
VARSRDVRPESYAKSDFGRDLLRARWDIQFFAERFLGISPHPGQSRLWDAIIARDESGWRPRYLNINASAGNRAGKTLGIAIPMLHSTMFKIGQEPPNPLDENAVRRWVTLPYEWYHFALQQEIAELAYIEQTRILSGTHEAQKHGCPLTDELGKSIADWSKKYRGEYLWLKFHEVLGGGEIHFRTTGEKAIGQLGKDMYGWSYDEGGFDPHMEFVVDEVLHMRRMSTGGQGWIIGTSTEGLTAFADRWEEGNPEAPDRKPDSFSMRMSTRENIGYGIDQTMFDRIVAAMPPDLIPQNIDGYFIQGTHAFFSAAAVDAMFDATLPETEPAQKGANYVQGVDPALTFDSTWSVVLKRPAAPALPSVGVLAGRVRGRSTGPTIAALATNNHHAYNVPGLSGCVTGIDATGFGGKMFMDLLYIKPVRAVEFGGTRGKKLKLLNTLKAAIEKGLLRFPRSGPWLQLRRQLLGYRLDDKGLETDAVMALAVAVWLTSLYPAGGSAPAVPFDYFNSGGNRVQLPAQGPAGPRLRNATYRSLTDFMRDGG